MSFDEDSFGLDEVLAAMAVGIPTRRWPTSAAACASAFGWGTWASAWLCDEASGNLADAFGGITLTAGTTPTYSNAGAISGGRDLAVGFDASTQDRFTAASVATYDLSDVTSLALYLCLHPSGNTNHNNAGKFQAGAGAWGTSLEVGGGITAATVDAIPTVATTTVNADHRGAFRDVLMVIDRTGQRLQLFTSLGTSTAVNITGIGSLTNAASFYLGGPPGLSTFGHTLAFAAVATGDIVNLRANGAQAIANIRNFTGRG